MQTVFNNDMVAHVWAQRSQTRGRNAGETFYFEQDTIYSYGYHFPLAEFARTPSGTDIVLVNSRSYSVTTAKHASYVRSAIPDGYFIATLPDNAWNSELLAYEYYANKLADLIEKAKRARVNGPWLLEQAEDTLSEANRLARLMQWAWTLEDATPQTLRASIREQSERARIERDKRERKQRIALMRDTHEHYVNWRNGLSSYCPAAWRSYHAKLTVHGGQVLTNLGASFPADHARRALPRLCGMLNDIRSAKTSDIFSAKFEIKLGHFKIDRIDADGTITAGCHRVRPQEVYRIGKLLSA
jgi:hypothetical protein